MTKIAYNDCYGGFSLSPEAVELYAKLKGIQLYRDKNGAYFTDPEHNHYYSYRDIPRTDPALIKVIEQLGSAANGPYAFLVICDLPSGTKYRIDEYDGNETVMTIDDYVWTTA